MSTKVRRLLEGDWLCELVLSLHRGCLFHRHATEGSKRLSTAWHGALSARVTIFCLRRPAIAPAPSRKFQALMMLPKVRRCARM
jgi:hypothetical protein